MKQLTAIYATKIKRSPRLPYLSQHACLKQKSCRGPSGKQCKPSRIRFVDERNLRDLIFVNASGAIKENANTHPTWRWPTRPLSVALRVDSAFHLSRFETSEPKIIKRADSRHSCVVVEQNTAKMGGNNSSLFRNDHFAVYSGDRDLCRLAVRPVD